MALDLMSLINVPSKLFYHSKPINLIFMRSPSLSKLYIKLGTFLVGIGGAMTFQSLQVVTKIRTLLKTNASISTNTD